MSMKGNRTDRLDGSKMVPISSKNRDDGEDLDDYIKTCRAFNRARKQLNMREHRSYPKKKKFHPGYFSSISVIQKRN